MKRFFNILIFSFLILVFSGHCFAKDIKFVQITDLHLTSNENSIENFERAINKINHTNGIDFVVFTGDNIDKANPEYLETFLRTAKKLNVPYYIEIGNHDCFRASGLSKKAYLQAINDNQLEKVKSFNFVKKNGKYVYVFVDGVKETIPSTNGYYKDDTIKWLDKIITKNKKKQVIIFQHFPLFDIAEKSNHNLYKADEYINMLKKHKNVLAIFTGHYHRNIEKYSDDGKYLNIVTPPAKTGSSVYREVYVIERGKDDFEIYSQIVKF